jgi:hypothetical protein
VIGIRLSLRGLKLTFPSAIAAKLLPSFLFSEITPSSDSASQPYTATHRSKYRDFAAIIFFNPAALSGRSK